MGIKINFDAAGNPIEPTFILTTHSSSRLGVLTGVSGINITDAFVDCPELAFSVTKSMTYDIWDSILDIKLIFSLLIHLIFSQFKSNISIKSK